MEAFDRVCEVLSKIHRARQTDWDLCVPAVQWAYWTMCKTLSAEMIPKVRNRVETVISEENTKKNPHVIALVVATVHEDHDQEITQICEVEHIRIHEAIR